MSRIESNVQKSSAARGTSATPNVASNRGTNSEEQLEDFQSLVEEVYESCSRYFKQRPVVASGVLVAVGFYLGWKMRP